jgi:restriction system protein
MRKDLNVIEFLAQIPWWVSVSLSAVVYIALKFLVPYVEAQSTLVNEVHVAFDPVFAPLVALAFLSPVTFSLLKFNRKKRLQDLKTEIQAIQELSWLEFKILVAEAYKRIGYMVLENSAFASDPSVDLVVRKGANLYLVQCRYWQNRKLGKREIKNLYSLMLDKHASGVFLLTTGVFTNEARYYAASRPVNLVDGIDLVELLGKVPQSASGRAN